jgi:diphthamide synthase (EF-2-diphthine--ammonia ligase)
MKFVALLSGGKDSCYNVIQCQKYGHELICLGIVKLLPTLYKQQYLLLYDIHFIPEHS